MDDKIGLEHLELVSAPFCGSTQPQPSPSLVRGNDLQLGQRAAVTVGKGQVVGLIVSTVGRSEMFH